MSTGVFESAAMEKIAAAIQSVADALAQPSLTQRVAALEAERTPTEADPPAAPSLLPCPFCGWDVDPPIADVTMCSACHAFVPTKAWNRRTPADARLRALAEAVVDAMESGGGIATAYDAMATYLRETAR